MQDRPMRVSVDDLYSDYKMMEADQEFYAIIDRSLGPRSDSMLFEKMAAMGVQVNDQVLDIGCGDARYSCELVKRLDCHVTAVDSVARSIERARNTVSQNGAGSKVDIFRGEIGRKAYEQELAICHWRVYVLLGKLLPVVYVLAKPN